MADKAAPASTSSESATPAVGSSAENQPTRSTSVDDETGDVNANDLAYDSQMESAIVESGQPAKQTPEVVAEDFVDSNPDAELTDTADRPQSTEAAMPPGSANAAAEASALVVKPTAAQLESWKIPEPHRLEFLAIRSDFEDAFLTCLAPLPDGRQFIIGGERLTLWKLGESEPSFDFLASLDPKPQPPILCLDVSTDGKLLAAGNSEGTVWIWDIADRSLVGSKAVAGSRVSQLAFSPNAKLLATTSYSGAVDVWTTDSLNKLSTHPIDEQEIRGMQFLSPTELVTLGSRALIWDVQAGKLVRDITEDRAFGDALDVSSQKGISFSDENNRVVIWDPEQGAFTAAWRGHNGPPDLARFSDDNRFLATVGQGSQLRIWDISHGQTIQALDAIDAAIADMGWLPGTGLLVVASRNGIFRVWGDKDAGVDFDVLPQAALPAEPSVPATADSIRSMLDWRSFPKLPGTETEFEQYQTASYLLTGSVDEASAFYRYAMQQRGWQTEADEYGREGSFRFRKNGFSAAIDITDRSGVPGGVKTAVSVRSQGNLDLRSLPKFAADSQKTVFENSDTVLYQVQADLTDIEVGLLKQLHAAGWTLYSRLHASQAEQPDMRTLSLVQNGLDLTVMIQRPATAPEAYSIQYSMSPLRCNLPIPDDCGFVELDPTGTFELVAATDLNLSAAEQFYNDRMQEQGWRALATSRSADAQQVFLRYFFEQQDVLIHLQTLKAGGTQIVAGGERAREASWQLRPADDVPDTAGIGMEAADFRVPDGAQEPRWDQDDDRIQYWLRDARLTDIADEYSALLTQQAWTKEDFGTESDTYVFRTFTKQDLEIQIRVSQRDENSISVIVSGDGLAWDKPLPNTNVPVSYETWLRRNHRWLTLDRLDEFHAAIQSLPKPSL